MASAVSNLPKPKVGPRRRRQLRQRRELSSSITPSHSNMRVFSEMPSIPDAPKTRKYLPRSFRRNSPINGTESQQKPFAQDTLPSGEDPGYDSEPWTGAVGFPGILNSDFPFYTGLIPDRFFSFRRDEDETALSCLPTLSSQTGIFPDRALRVSVMSSSSGSGLIRDLKICAEAVHPSITLTTSENQAGAVMSGSHFNNAPANNSTNLVDEDTDDQSESKLMYMPQLAKTEDSLDGMLRPESNTFHQTPYEHGFSPAPGTPPSVQSFMWDSEASTNVKECSVSKNDIPQYPVPLSTSEIPSSPLRTKSSASKHRKSRKPARRSKRCWTCIINSEDCDRSKPTCKLCAQRGVTCYKYGPQRPKLPEAKAFEHSSDSPLRVPLQKPTRQRRGVVLRHTSRLG